MFLDDDLGGDTGSTEPSATTKGEEAVPTRLVDQMPVIPDYLKPKPQKTVGDCIGTNRRNIFFPEKWSSWLIFFLKFWILRKVLVYQNTEKFQPRVGKLRLLTSVYNCLSERSYWPSLLLIQCEFGFPIVINETS